MSGSQSPQNFSLVVPKNSAEESNFRQFPTLTAPKRPINTVISQLFRVCITYYAKETLSLFGRCVANGQKLTLRV